MGRQNYDKVKLSFFSTTLLYWSHLSDYYNKKK